MLWEWGCRGEAWEGWGDLGERGKIGVKNLNEAGYGGELSRRVLRFIPFLLSFRAGLERGRSDGGKIN